MTDVRRSLPMLVALCVGIALANAAGAGSPASMRWRSNIWQNPTSSILCRYSPTATIITCTSQYTGLSVKVGEDGPTIPARPARLTHVWAVRPPSRRVPVLWYGESWKSDEFMCVPRTAGVTCQIAPDMRDLLGNHGFFLARRHAWRW